MLVGDLWCSLECTPPCQGGGRGFKSRQVRHSGIPSWDPERGRVAQLVERAPEKREVTGSTPVPTTRKSQFRALRVPVDPLGAFGPCPLRAQKTGSVEMGSTAITKADQPQMLTPSRWSGAPDPSQDDVPDEGQTTIKLLWIRKTSNGSRRNFAGDLRGPITPRSSICQVHEKLLLDHTRTGVPAIPRVENRGMHGKRWRRFLADITTM